MSSMSLTFNGSIIGISYGEMNSVKSNLRRASDMLQQSQSKVNSAKTKVQVDRSSSRLRLSEEQISTIYTNATKQKTKIDKLCNNIDITIRKFKEVDARCAARIRSISKSYDKSKSLWDRIKSAVSSFSAFAMNGFKSLIDMGKEAFSALGQKISEGFNAVSEWMDKHPVITNVVSGALDALTIVGAAAAIVAGTVTGVGIVVAVVGAVYAASTLIDSGVKIYNNIKSGTNSGFNFIEEGFKKVMGDTAGEVAFGVTNLIALAVNLPSMAKGALKLGTGAINFFKEGEGIAKIGASLSSIGGNISNFLEEGKAAFKTLGEVGTNKLSDFFESVKDVKNNIGKTLEEIKVNIENIGPKPAYELKGDGNNHYKFDVIDNRITNTSDNYKFSGVDEVKKSAEKISNAELNTCDSIQKIISGKGYSVDEFVKLLHPDRVLNTDEKAIVESIRDEIGIPDVGTKMTKVIPQSDIYKYLYDSQYEGVRGFTAVDEHSANLRTLYENYEGARLDYDNTMFKLDNGVNGISKQVGAPDRFYGTIEYIENDPSKLVIPRWEANAENYPYTARGFTGSKNIVLPEFAYQQGYTRKFQTGDMLNIRDSNTGEVIQRFIYDEDSTEKWIIGG